MATVKLVTAGDCVKVWKGTELEAQYSPHGLCEVSQVCWSPDGMYLATSSVSKNSVAVSHFKNPSATIDLQSDVRQSFVRFGFTQSRTLITCGDHSDVLLWNVNTRKIQKRLSCSLQAISCVTFNRTDTHVACGSRAGEVMLINATSGVCNTMMKTPKTTSISCLAFSAKVKSLLGALSEESGLNLWDSNTCSLVHAYGSQHIELATGFAFSPINDMLAASVGLDKHMVFYDLRQKQIVSVAAFDEPITCLDFLDGRNITMGTRTGRLHFYDLRTSSTKQVVRAHESSINSIKYRNCKVLLKGSGVAWSEPLASTASAPDTSQNPHSQTNGASTRNRFDDATVFSPLQGSNTVTAVQHGSFNDSPTDFLMSFSKAPAIDEVSIMEHNGQSEGDGINVCADNCSKQCLAPSENIHAQIPMEDASSDTPEKVDPLAASVAAAAAAPAPAPVDAELHGSAAPAAATAAAVPIASPPLDLSLLRTVVSDVVDDLAEQIHQDIINKHVDMIKFFQIIQNDFETRLQQVTRNEELLLETIERLRAEVQRLRRGQ